jgi:hypothetical protein
VCCGLAHRTVRCTRTVQSPNNHSRVFASALRYNSPDCLVHQRSNGYPAQRSTATTLWRVNSEEQCAQSQSAEVRGTPGSEQYLSGAAPDCPVPQEDKASNGQLLQYPNGWVMWRHTGQCPVADRTVRCAHRQQPSLTACWWLRAINTPNHHNSKHPSILNIEFNTRAIEFTPRHNQSNRSTQSPQINFSALGLVRWSLMFLCYYCLLGLAFFFFSILTLKCFVSKARDTNCVVVLAGSKWPVRLRKKAHSVYVTVWERERVERDPVFVTTSTGTRFFRTESR